MKRQSFSKLLQSELFFKNCQKQPSEVFCRRRSSLKFRKFHWKTSVLESIFNKVAGLKACNFIKKRLQHTCFPIKYAKFLRTPILKNICDDCFSTVDHVTVVVTYKSEIYAWEVCKEENYQLSWRSWCTEKWCTEWQQVTTSGRTSDNNNKKLLLWLIFFVFRIREEPSIRHSKENPLNFEEDLEEDLQN